MADDAVVEPDRALVLRQSCGLGLEAGDGIVARLLRADLVGELAAAPRVDGDVTRRADEGVKTAQLFGDGGVFECRIEDIHRLVLAAHVAAILPVVMAAPRWLPEREERSGASGVLERRTSIVR